MNPTVDPTLTVGGYSKYRRASSNTNSNSDNDHDSDDDKINVINTANNANINLSLIATTPSPSAAQATTYTIIGYTTYSCNNFISCQLCTENDCYWDCSNNICSPTTVTGCDDLKCGVPSDKNNHESGPFILWLLLLGTFLLLTFALCYHCRRQRRIRRPQENQPIMVVIPTHSSSSHPALPPPPYPLHPPTSILVANLLNKTTPALDPEKIPLTDHVTSTALKSTDSISAEDARELLLCGICKENAKSISLGCGHLMCDACTRKIKTCPFCKREITSVHRIYF